MGQTTRSWDIAAPLARSPTVALASQGHRLIATERILREGIPAGRKGPGPGATALVAVLAAAAASTKAFGTPQGPEERRVPIQRDGIVFPDVTRGQGKKPRWAELARVRDEHDAVAVAYSRRVGHRPSGPRGHPASGASGTLEHHAPEVRPLRGRDDRPLALTHVEQPLEKLLALGGCDGLEHHASPDRHEKEEAPSRGPDLGGPSVDRGQVRQGFGAHERVDLERQPPRPSRRGPLPSCADSSRAHRGARRGGQPRSRRGSARPLPPRPGSAPPPRRWSGEGSHWAPRRPRSRVAAPPRSGRTGPHASGGLLRSGRDGVTALRTAKARRGA